MSLRRRLSLGFIALAALLVIANVMLYRTVASSLQSAVDERLLASGNGPGRGGGGPGGDGPGGGGPGGDGDNGGGRRPEPDNRGTDATTTLGSQATTPALEWSAEQIRRVPGGNQLLLQIRDSSGGIVAEIFPGQDVGDAAPTLDAATVRARASSEGQPQQVFTAEAGENGGGAYRVVVTRSRDGGYFVRGASLAETDSTMRRVLLLQAGTTGVVLLGFLLVGWNVTRLGLRPIQAMTDTALAIAGGDLEREIPPASTTTEAGQLATSLNAMLTRLRTALADEERSSTHLRQFVADASHELRTPLTSIRGYTELLRGDGLSPGDESDEALRRLDQEAHRMSGLVDELLLLARLDQGRPLDMHPVELNRIIEEAATDLRILQPERPVRLHLPPGGCRVDGDAGRLQQVATNLLGNIRSHTPPDAPVEIAVRAEGDQVILEVADRGPGLPPGEEDQVFERFYRADPARSGPGSGLGLSIVSAIAAAHGGRAQAARRDGGGTVITVSLPARSA